MTARAEAAKARTDQRAWVVKRQSRSRHLIELGGLVHKAGLVDLTDDERSTLLGAMLAPADMPSEEGGPALRDVRRRRGK